jgi:adenylyltransferase/sulfurtransferase
MNNISPNELKAWMDEKQPFMLIDVREAWEREAFNIGGEHIPQNEIMDRKGEIPVDKPIVVYCEKGIRSTIIVQRLEAAGFTNLFNLSGGMTSWKRSF